MYTVQHVLGKPWVKGQHDKLEFSSIDCLYTTLWSQYCDVGVTRDPCPWWSRSPVPPASLYSCPAVVGITSDLYILFKAFFFSSF